MADIEPAKYGVDVDIIEGGNSPVPVGAADDVVLEDGAPKLPKRAQRFSDGSIRLEFREPVVLRYRSGADAPIREERYEDLTFRRLKGADMRAIGAAAREDQAVVMIARSTQMQLGLMQRLYDRMDAEDIAAATEIVARFLGIGLPTTGR